MGFLNKILETVGLEDMFPGASGEESNSKKGNGDDRSGQFQSKTFALESDELVWLKYGSAVMVSYIAVGDPEDGYARAGADDYFEDDPESLKILEVKHLKMIESPYQLGEIARHDSRESIRLAAIGYLTNAVLLKKIADSDPSKEVQAVARERIDSGGATMVEAGAFALYDDSLYYIVKVSKDGADVSLVRMDDYRDGYRKDDIDKVSVDAVHMIPIPALQQIYGEGKVNVNDSEEIHYTTELASGRKLRVVIEDKDTFNVAMMIKNRVGSFYLDYDPKKKMPKERQEIDQWEEQDGNDEKFFFADGLFTEGGRTELQKTKAILEQVDPDFGKSITTMMKKNRFSAFNFSEGSGQVAIGEADFEGVLTLKSWYGLKEALSHLVPLTGEAVEFLEQYACVIEEMEGEYNQTRAPATVDELLVKSLINCQFCASRVHVGANKVCLNCGGNNG